MGFIVKPFDFSVDEISNGIILGVIAGLIGDLTVGYIVKRTR